MALVFQYFDIFSFLFILAQIAHGHVYTTFYYL